jgi:AcrR family transcriptional regulator
VTSASAWLREAQTELAETRLLEAAGRAFVEIGVGAVTMSDVARHAGCSRGTVYRYFPSREALHLAYVRHGARQIAAEVRARTAGLADPRERIVATIVESVRAVRARPDMAVWFDPDQAGFTARLSHRPELIDSLTGGLAASLGEEVAPRDAATQQSLRWVVRVIVSLLGMPAADEEEERVLVRRFVAPAFAPAGEA